MFDSSNVKSKSPASDNVFVANAASLKPGDILLSTNTNSVISKIVRNRTNSSFSHTALFFLHSNCVEAVGDGVRVMCIDRVHINDIKNVMILRLRNQNNGNTEIAMKAAEIAKNFLFRPYSFKGAMMATLPVGTKQATDNSFFCSQLVAQCYRDAGLDLFPDIPAEKIVPGDFTDLNDILMDVTREVFQQVNRKLAPLCGLDTNGYPESGESSFSVLNRRISEDLSKSLSSYDWFKPFHNNLHQIADWYAFFCIQEMNDDCKTIFDDALFDALEKHRFSDFLQYTLPLLNPWTFMALDQYAALLKIVSKDTLLGIQSDLVRAQSSLKINQSEFDKGRDDALKYYQQISGYKSVAVLANFYRDRSKRIAAQNDRVETRLNLVSQQLAV